LYGNSQQHFLSLFLHLSDKRRDKDWLNEIFYVSLHVHIKIGLRIHIRMKGATDTIKHIGTISRIEGNILHVKMLQGSACAGCHAAKLCQSSETKEKEVDVICKDVTRYRVGQNVLLLGSIHQGLKATVWAYMLPIVLLVVVLFACFKMGVGETLSALLSLGAVAVYFMGIYLCRDKFQKQFSFSVRETLGE